MGSGGGESSRGCSSTDDTSLSENDLVPDETQGTADMEGAGSSSSGLHILSGDIAQLNSDTDDE